MQNKHYFFFSFLGIPTFGEGGGSSRLGQNPNFYQKFVLEASLFLGPSEKKAKRKPYFCPNSICISVAQFCKFLAEVFCEKSDLMFPSEPGLYFRLEPGEKRNFPHLVTN